MAAASRPRPSLVTSDEPTFTTSVVALSIIFFASFLGDGLHQRVAAFAR